jgi:hypothetical protein
MCLFHDKDDFRPFNDLRCNRYLSVVIKASRVALQRRARRKNLLCRRTAEPILAANEKNTFHMISLTPELTGGEAVRVERNVGP